MATVCSQCQNTEHEQGAVFCDQCGARLQTPDLEQLAEEKGIANHFCPECGNSIRFDPTSVSRMVCAHCESELVFNSGRLVKEVIVLPLSQQPSNSVNIGGLVTFGVGQGTLQYPTDEDRLVVVPQDILEAGVDAVRNYLLEQGFSPEGVEEKIRKFGLH